MLWRFWAASTYDEAEFLEDLENIVSYYNERGYYDARNLSDSVELFNGNDPGLNVYIDVHEGPQYHIRNIAWEGNTVYSDAALTQTLGFERGDVFDSRQLEQNLYANRASTDVASLYLNRGYMRFNVAPTINVVEGDSLDLLFDITEGEVYSFGEINILGNTKTNEHVVRRELYTVPGQTFSRDSIQESIRRLSQLNYFTPDSTEDGHVVQCGDGRRVVVLTYRVGDARLGLLALSGPWGRWRLLLMRRFPFNRVPCSKNIYADGWRSVFTGDGPLLS